MSTGACDCRKRAPHRRSHAGDQASLKQASLQGGKAARKGSAGKSSSWMELDPQFRQLLAGPAESRDIAQLLREVEPRAFEAARRMLRNLPGGRAAADDAVQQWNAIVASQTGWNAEKPAAPYAYRILRNICVAIYRRRRREHFLSDWSEVRDEGADPSQLVAQNEARAMLLKALEQLAQPFRRALRMQYFEGLSAAEAAKLEGMSPAAMRSLRWRARCALRKQLAPREILFH